MEFYYSPEILLQQFILPEQESYHCIKVLRHKEGDIIHVVDGMGGLYECEITRAHKQHCAFNIIHQQKNYGKRNYSLHIALAPTKNIERFEWFMEKTTEIGIDSITPLICDHSERRKLNTERLNNILISAMKQSLKAYLPKLNEPVDFLSFIEKQIPVPAQKFICHLNQENKINLSTVCSRGGQTLILVGPEGDFSKREIDWAAEYNFHQVTLGESRLRTETAGVVACYTINLINEAITLNEILS